MLRIAPDTDAINRIADSPEILKELQTAVCNSRLILISNHVVKDQLFATSDHERRNHLLRVYDALPIREVKTSGGIWGISKWGESMWGDSSLTGLSINDARTPGRGGAHDALIGITAADNADVLVTDDAALRKKLITNKSACAVWSFSDLCKFLREPKS